MKRKLQQMFFSVDKFNTSKKVREWIKKHSVKKLSYQKKPVKKFENEKGEKEYRVRIRERKFFNIESLKKEYVEPGVWAMFGNIKEDGDRNA